MRAIKTPRGLVVEEEVPVNGDLWAALRTPAHSEDTFKGLAALRLGFAAVDVPHAERDLASCMHDHFVVIMAVADEAEAVLLLLGERGSVGGDVQVGEVVYGMVRHRHRRRASGLGQGRVLEDPVGETGGERRALAVRGAVYMALEVGRQPDGHVGARGRVNLEVELCGPCGEEVPAHFDFYRIGVVTAGEHAETVIDGLVSGPVMWQYE